MPRRRAIIRCEEMMVLREMSVECPAKIAMTALPDASATMGLLLKACHARRIFLDRRVL
jgi:hypothetical protein